MRRHSTQATGRTPATVTPHVSAYPGFRIEGREIDCYARGEAMRGTLLCSFDARSGTPARCGQIHCEHPDTGEAGTYAALYMGGDWTVVLTRPITENA